ncbi:MAG: NAD(P)H-binding protein [Acidimicrobiales bacterium]
MQNTTPSPSTRTTLVIGATGKTGRRVADRLRAAGVPTKAASRSSEVRFDWEDPSTWAPALTDVDAAYVTYFPDLAIPGADEVVGSFVETALSNGVRRLVLLSGRGEEGARRAEVRVQDSGADWTIVRCAFFNQNFSETFVDAVRHGVLAMPGGDAAEPFLDADDIADVVVASLLDDRHIGQLYELTGPRLLTLTEVARTLSAAIDREVSFVPMSKEAYAADISQQGFPGEVAQHIADVIALALDGRNAVVTQDVEKVLGRPARDFADYARAAAAAGAWDLPVSATV